MTWELFIKNERQKPYFKNLWYQVMKAYQETSVYPAFADIFRAFDLTPLDKVRVVILGQDPYHQKGQAMGLAFSVNESEKIPPSLNNIFKELYDDLGIVLENGDLTKWAKQGVFLLNTILTVSDSLPLSHQLYGWEKFSENVISLLNLQSNPIVFILWGQKAQTYKKLVTARHHLVLTSAHPSPLSAHRGFFGSKPFSKTRQFLNDYHLFE